MSEAGAVDKAFETPRDLRSKLRMWFDPEYVCVLTIGKTASSSIISALLDADLEAYQAHTLVRAPQEYLFVAGLPASPVQNAAFQLKTKAWLSLTKGSRKKFITTFRDPFARNISAFFEQAWKLEVEVEKMETAELISLYEERGPHDVTRTWFADNIMGTFGVDLRDLDLVDQPTQVLTTAKREFLFMKYEDQSRWEDSLTEFLGTDIKLQRRNDSSRKSYFEAMARLKSEWRPSAEIVERTVDRQLWDAIYNDEEKSEIRERWEIASSHGL